MYILIDSYRHKQTNKILSVWTVESCHTSVNRSFSLKELQSYVILYQKMF